MPTLRSLPIGSFVARGLRQLASSTPVRQAIVTLAVAAAWLPLRASGAGDAAAPAKTPAVSGDPILPHVIARTYQVMGTDLAMTAYTADDRGAVDAFAAAYKEVLRLETLMTDWERPGQPPSDVVRINAVAGKSAVEVAPETWDVILKAQDMSRRSGGAFDITYAAMRGLWKFDEDLEKKRPPAADIARQRRLINWRDVILDHAHHTVKLRRAGMRLGLGGIAKGYAVDKAVAVIKARGFGDIMVQAGGDLYVAGQKGPTNWHVGVRDPRGGPTDIVAMMPIKDHAFSTAGDYERSFILDGKRYHHIIDPKTGYPATASREVTIFAPTAFEADAIDDAIFILGPKKGLALAAQFKDTAALVIDANNKIWMSPSLEGKLRVVNQPKAGI